jgi:hypothetical protein
MMSVEWDVFMPKRTKFYDTTNEYAQRKHFSPRNVRRMCEKGQIKCVRYGHRWLIPRDQTKDMSPTPWTFPKSGMQVEVPSIPPDGFIWDPKREQLVLKEKFAKENKLPLITKGGKRLIDCRIGVSKEIYKQRYPHGRVGLDPSRIPKIHLRKKK